MKNTGSRPTSKKRRSRADRSSSRMARASPRRRASSAASSWDARRSALIFASSDVATEYLPSFSFFSLSRFVDGLGSPAPQRGRNSRDGRRCFAAFSARARWNLETPTGTSAATRSGDGFVRSSATSSSTTRPTPVTQWAAAGAGPATASRGGGGAASAAGDSGARSGALASMGGGLRALTGDFDRAWADRGRGGGDRDRGGGDRDRACADLGRAAGLAAARSLSSRALAARISRSRNSQQMRTSRRNGARRPCSATSSWRLCMALPTVGVRRVPGAGYRHGQPQV